MLWKVPVLNTKTYVVNPPSSQEVGYISIKAFFLYPPNTAVLQCLAPTLEGVIQNPVSLRCAQAKN